jgi:hypothetical protein
MGKLDRSERTTLLLREPQKDAYEDLACSYSAYAVSECLQSLEGASQFENYRLTEILSWLRSMQGPRSLEANQVVHQEIDPEESLLPLGTNCQSPPRRPALRSEREMRSFVQAGTDFVSRRAPA